MYANRGRIDGSAVHGMHHSAIYEAFRVHLVRDVTRNATEGGVLDPNGHVVHGPDRQEPDAGR